MRSLIGMYATTRRKSFLTKKNTDQKNADGPTWIYEYTQTAENTKRLIYKNKTLHLALSKCEWCQLCWRLWAFDAYIWRLQLDLKSAFACSHSLGVYTARFMKQTLAKVKIRCNFWKHVEGEKLLFGLSADWYFKVHSYAWISSLD